MKIPRREFLKSVGVIGAASGLQPAAALAQVSQGKKNTALSVGVLFDPGIPISAEIPVSRDLLDRALRGYQVTYLRAADFASGLATGAFDCVVNPYGSAFPRDSFPAIKQYLAGGGNWVNVGGTFLSIPIVNKGGTWVPESRQTAYHQDFGITQAYAVSTTGIAAYTENPEIEFSRDLKGEFTAAAVNEYYCRFTETKDYPGEDGSAGPRLAALRPLVTGRAADSTPLAAPFVVVERLLGACSGGRWVLASFTGSISSRGLRTLVEIASRGTWQLSVRGNYARLFPGEPLTLLLRIKPPRAHVPFKGSVQCIIRKEFNTIVSSFETQFSMPEGESNYEFAIGKNIQHLGDGFHSVEARITVEVIDRKKTYKFLLHNGLWNIKNVSDSNKRMWSTDGRYVTMDGRAYPVTGTTYMASDVHRKYLLDPNPFVWDEDFRRMKECGINMVRTGIWTAWREMMPADAPGPNASVLRAMDAFVLTAIRHEMPLIMTLFAFLPEAWGGENSYLDPHALELQKKFIAAFASRYRDVDLLFWDLINEPSFCNPKHLWECKPNYDRFEAAAWRDWLLKRRSTAEGFRSDGTSDPDLPALDEFDDANIVSRHHPIKALEYRFFAQEQFAAWAAAMAGVIRQVGNPRQLITVGQDEGGTGESPANQFFAPAVDFTSVHNWWLNDDLAWDSIVTKVPGKANLVEETGVMFYEKMDGTPWRAEEDVRDLLERKLAISFGTGCAGFVEWIWCTNPYMPSDNEAAIGLHRPDGTAKPELQAVRNFAAFYREQAKHFHGAVNPEIAIVIPHTQQLSPRSLGGEGTKRAVRTLLGAHGIVPSSISEYHLESLAASPSFLLLPAPQVVSSDAWTRLLAAVDAGATLVVTGPLDLDEHWLPVDRMKALGIPSRRSPVAETEVLQIDGSSFEIPFRGTKMERVSKSIIDGQQAPEPVRIRHGKGEILWCPLPIELGDDDRPVTEFYASAFKAALDRRPVLLAHPSLEVQLLTVVFDESILCVLVSLGDRALTVELSHRASGTTHGITLPRRRTATVIMDRKSGDLLETMKTED